MFYSIVSNKHVVVFIDGDNHTIPASSPIFDEVSVAAERNDVVRVKALMAKTDKKPKLVNAIHNISGFRLEGNILTYNGIVVTNYIVDKILELRDHNYEFLPHLNFLKRMIASRLNYHGEGYDRIWINLYKFLEVNELPLTTDGGFIAYKQTGKDGWSITNDKKTGQKVKYTVGQYTEMPREEVSQCVDQCNGPGLYFGGKNYYKNGYFGEETYIVLIYPEWVVSVPDAEVNSKGRAYKMKVLQKVTGAHIGQSLEKKKTYDVDKPLKPVYKRDNKGRFSK